MSRRRSTVSAQRFVAVVFAAALLTAVGWVRITPGEAACSDPARSVPLITAVAPDGLVTTQAGMVVSTGGDVLTQWSWVRDARRILVTLPGEAPVSARPLGASAGRDLVLLKIESRVALCPIAFGGVPAPAIGQTVRIYGYPFANSLRSDFLTAETGRITAVKGAPVRTFRSDLVVDPGFAGSPILDARGKAIGVQRVLGGRAVWRDTWADPATGLSGLIERLRRAPPAVRPADAPRPWSAIARRRPPGREFTIAVHVSLSGPRAMVGRSILDGVAQAVADLGGAFRAHGIGIRVLSLDDRDDSKTAIANARERLLDDPSVLLVIGNSDTSVCQNLAPVYEQGGLPNITPACEVSTLTGGGLRALFRVIGRDDLQGAAAARFAGGTMRARTAYVVYDPVNYGLRTAAAFWWESKRLGMRVAGLTPVSAATVRTVAASAARARSDVVYYGGEAPGAARFLQALRALGARAVLLGPDGLDSSEFGYLAGPAAAGTTYTVLDAPPHFYEHGGSLAGRLRARARRDPGPFAALAYDATGIGLEAIAHAGKGYRRMPNREEVLAALHDPSLSFRGVTGTVRFMTNGDRVRSPVFVMQVIGPAWSDWPNNRLVATITP